MNTRDRPFYKFEYGTSYIFFVETLIGVFIGTGAAALGFLLTSNQLALISLWIAITGILAYVIGHFITKVLFFVYRKMSITCGLLCTGIAEMIFTGVSSCLGYFELAGVQFVLIGIVLIVASLLLLFVFNARYGKIGLFTDGIKIGKRTFYYSDIIKQPSYGTGPIEKKIPEEDKDKQVTMLTPIEYEYQEKNFGIFHVYLIFVTKDTVYIAQSINKQSNLAQDSRNAWSRCILGQE